MTSRKTLRHRIADARRGSRNFMGVRILDPQAQFSRGLYDPQADEAAVESILRSYRSMPVHYAGDIKTKRGTPVALTVTNLQSLASSSTFQSGWTSAWVDDTSINAFTYEVSGALKANNTSLTAGSARVYCYALHADGSTAPDIFSSGTEGTEGAATVHDSEQLDASLILLWSTSIDTTAGDVYTMPSRSILQAFGCVPLKWALYVAHDTVQALHSSGNAFYYTPILSQYT